MRLFNSGVPHICNFQKIPTRNITFLTLQLNRNKHRHLNEANNLPIKRLNFEVV